MTNPIGAPSYSFNGFNCWPVSTSGLTNFFCERAAAFVNDTCAAELPSNIKKEETFGNSTLLAMLLGAICIMVTIDRLERRWESQY